MWRLSIGTSSTSRPEISVDVENLLAPLAHNFLPSSVSSLSRLETPESLDGISDLRLRITDLKTVCVSRPYTTIRLTAMKARPTSSMLQYIAAVIKSAYARQQIVQGFFCYQLAHET